MLFEDHAVVRPYSGQFSLYFQRCVTERKFTLEFTVQSSEIGGLSANYWNNTRGNEGNDAG